MTISGYRKFPISQSLKPLSSQWLVLIGLTQTFIANELFTSMGSTAMLSFVKSALATIAFICFSSCDAIAAPILFIEPPTNRESLTVGESATFRLELADLSHGEELDSLVATIKFDGNLLGVPQITGGEILPNPLYEPTDFVSSEDSGLADVAFLTLGEDPKHRINTNGTFVSFEVELIAVGSGTMAFEFIGATQFDVNGPIIVDLPAVAPLNFTVVPEPSTLPLILSFSPLILPRLIKRCR